MSQVKINISMSDGDNTIWIHSKPISEKAMYRLGADALHKVASAAEAELYKQIKADMKKSEPGRVGTNA